MMTKTDYCRYFLISSYPSPAILYPPSARLLQGVLTNGGARLLTGGTRLLTRALTNHDAY